MKNYKYQKDTIKVVFFGTPKHVVCVPEALKDSGIEVVAVVTQPAKPVGRDQVITPSPVALWAQKNGVKILDESPKLILEDLRSLGAELGVLEAYGRLLPNELLEIFPKGIINVHPSLLPKYRGASPIQATLLNGDPITGVTVIKLDSQMDHGPILDQREFEVETDDTLDSLQTRLFNESAKMLCQIIPEYLNNKITLIPQDESQATFTWKTGETKRVAYIDLNNLPSLEVLDQKIRAFFPEPVAWTTWRDKHIKFLPGGLVQMEGKKPTLLKDFLNGYPDFPVKQLR